jgi:hypothetical protein
MTRNSQNDKGPSALYLDFEAPSLSGNSYPIEVASNLENGLVERHLY